MKTPPTSSLMDEHMSVGDLQSFYTQASFYQQNKYERQFVFNTIADEVACLSVECKLLADRVDCSPNDRSISDELNRKRRILADLFVKQIVLTQEDVPVVSRSATTSVTKMLGASSTESLDTIREVESELERSVGSGATFASGSIGNGASSHGGSIGSGTTVLSPGIDHGSIVKQEVHGLVNPEDVIASLHLPDGARIKTKEVIIHNGHQVDSSEHTLVNDHHIAEHHSGLQERSGLQEYSGHDEHSDHHEHSGHHHEHSGHHLEHSGHHHEHSGLQERTGHHHEHSGHHHEHSGHHHEHSGHHHEHSGHHHEHSGLQEHSGHHEHSGLQERSGHHEHSGHHHEHSGHDHEHSGLQERSGHHGHHEHVSGTSGLSLHASDSHRTASVEKVVDRSSFATAHHTVISGSTGHQTIGGHHNAHEGALTHHSDGRSGHGHHSHHDHHHHHRHHHDLDELDTRLHQPHEHSHLDGVIHDGELPRRDDFFELISTVVTDWQVNKHGHITDIALDVELRIASLGEVDAIVPLSYLDIVNIETIKLEPEWKVFDEVTVINTVEYEYEEKVKGPPKITNVEETEIETKVSTDYEIQQRKWRLEEEKRLERERLTRIEEETRIERERLKRIEEEARIERERREETARIEREQQQQKWRLEEEARIEAERRRRREEEEARRQTATTSVRKEVTVETVQRTAKSDSFNANRDIFEKLSQQTGPSSPIENQNRYTNRRQYAPASHHRPHAAEYKVVGSYVNTKETVYKPTNRGVDETPILGQNAIAGSKSYWTSASAQSNVAEFDRLSNAKYELKQTTVEPPTSRQIGVFTTKKTTLFDDDKTVDDTHELFRAKAFAHRRQEIQADEPAAIATRTSGSLSSQHFASTGGSTGRLSTESSESSKVNGSGTVTNGSTIYSVMKKSSSPSNGNPFESDGYVSQYSNKGANYSFTAGAAGKQTATTTTTTESSHTTETYVQHSSSGDQLQRTGGKYVIEHDSPAIRSYRITADK